MRLIRFIRHWVRMRSLSLALWLDEYDNHKPKY